MSQQTSDIKRAIGVLCKHLNDLYHLDMKPEHFRLAKHDKIEGNVVEKFWKLLNILTINDSVSNVEDIKQYMIDISYASRPFFELPTDMSRGSRELLIATACVLQSSLAYTIENTLRNSAFSDEFDIFGDQLVRMTRLPFNHIKTKSDCSNYMQWIEGKVQQNDRLMKEYEISNSKLLNKLQEDIDVNVNSLNISEILAFTSRKYSGMFLQNSENIVEILENHENWLKKSGVFWRWMRTVVEQRKKSLK